MSDKRSVPDVVGLLVLVLAVAAIVGSVYFISRLSETAMNFIAGAASLAIVGIPSTLGMYWLSRRDRPAPQMDDRYIEQPRQQLTYYQDAKQDMDLELRRLKLESARARMLLPSANPTTPAPDTFEQFAPSAQSRPTARQVIVLGGDSDD